MVLNIFLLPGGGQHKSNAAEAGKSSEDSTTLGNGKRRSSSGASQSNGDPPEATQPSNRTHATLTDDNANEAPEGDVTSSPSGKKETLAEMAGMAGSEGTRGGDSTESGKGISSKTFYGGSWNRDNDQQVGGGDGSGSAEMEQEDASKTGGPLDATSQVKLCFGQPFQKAIM